MNETREYTRKGMIHREYPDGVRTFQIQGLRCKSCDLPFTTEVEVNVPVELWFASMTSRSCPDCGSRDLHLGMGLSLSEDRARRPSGGSIEERLADWYRNGERGLSSQYVADRMMGREADPAHPCDYADLKRVILLLDRIPEWAPRMKELSDLPGWRRISEEWDLIVEAVIAADPEARNPVAAAAVLDGIYR